MTSKLEIIGIDHGWSMMKGTNDVFVTGVKEITTTPAMYADTLEYQSRYYRVGTTRQEVKNTKTEDDTFYLLTLAAVAKALKRRGLTEARVFLAVGLPLTRFGAEKADFIKYRVCQLNCVSLFYLILFFSVAAITAIDPSLYEAASIDGAGRFAKIKYVTLPGIKPTIIILLLMNVGNVLNAGFEIQYLLGNGLVQSVSQTIDIYVLKWGISQGDYAIGTAAGIFKSLVSIILIVIANTIAKHNGEERLF